MVWALAGKVCLLLMHSRRCKCAGSPDRSAIAAHQLLPGLPARPYATQLICFAPKGGPVAPGPLPSVHRHCGPPIVLAARPCKRPARPPKTPLLPFAAPASSCRHPMGDTSSDDELPLAQRATGILLAGSGGGRPPPAPAASSGSDSDVPSWLQAKGKGNQVITLDSSSEDDAVISPAKPAAPAAAPRGGSQPAAEPAGNRDVQHPAAAQQGAAALSPKPRSAAKARATPGRGRAAAAAAAAAPAGPDEEAAPSGTQPTATQATGTATQATGGGTAQKRGAAAGVPHASTTSMPVVLPDKLPQIKMLVELECSAGAASPPHPCRPAPLPLGGLYCGTRGAAAATGLW